MLAGRDKSIRFGPAGQCLLWLCGRDGRNTNKFLHELVIIFDGRNTDIVI